MDFVDFCLTLGVAFVSGYIGFRLKLPAGAMIGAVLGTVFLNLVFERTYFYADLRVVIQMVSGAMIGSRIGKKDLLSLKTILLPSLLLLVGMLAFNLAFGTLMSRFGGLDVPTALFATAPGGMADMALISSELGATTAYVGILQMLRILVIILTMPPLFKWLLRKRGYGGHEEIVLLSADVEDPAMQVSADVEGPAMQVPVDMEDPAVQASVDAEDPAVQASVDAEDTAAPVPAACPGTGMSNRWRKLVSRIPHRLLILLAVAAAGGLFFRQLGVTAGALTGGMIASAVYCVTRGTVKFPNGLKFLLQIVAGAYIGIGIDRACVATMPNLLVPALIMIVGIYLFVFLMAGLMRRIFHLDLAVCMLACTPGGVQEMSLLSEELGADTAKIAVMQTIRLTFVILLFPTMLGIVARCTMAQ